jgi:hypothetical protein
MTIEIKMKPLVDYDGVLTNEERKKILNRLESAFNWLGASIPKKVEIDGETFKLREEMHNLIMKPELTSTENKRIVKLISTLEIHKDFLKNMVQEEEISEEEAMEISNQICGILRAVHELREIVKKSSKSKALNAKSELMKEIEDKKRWIKYTRRIR